MSVRSLRSDRRPSAPRSRRLVAALVALGLALGATACSDDGGDDDASDDTTTTEATDTEGSEGEGEGEGEADGPLRILVSNDDGYSAEGIDAVVEGLTGLDDVEVTVVAPLEQKSGSGGTYTDGEVATSEVETASGYPATAVDGFPADAVTTALEDMGLEPHVVVSGINEGQNIGQLVDVSGTVGAARAAVAGGIPSLAVSSGLEGYDYAAAVPLVLDWVEERREALLAGEAPVEVASMNVPSCTEGELRGLVEVPVATTGEFLDPQDCTSTLEDPADDTEAFLNGFASLTIVPDEPETPPSPVTTVPGAEGSTSTTAAG
jgi:5'-nucleotidase